MSTAQTPIEQAQASAHRRRATAIIFGIVLLDMMGIGLIAPLTPYLTERFSDSAIQVGILTAAYSAAQFIFAPVLGALSDRFGRRPVLIFSLLGTAIGYFIFAQAQVYWLLVAARLLDGATGGNISTAQAYIADITPPKDRAKTFGLMGAAFGLGFTLGPGLGAALSPLHQMAPVWAAGGFALIAMICVIVFLPETLPPERRATGSVSFANLNPASGLARAFAIAGVPSFLLCIFGIAFAHAEMRASLGIYAKQRFDFTQHNAEFMFVFMGVIAIIVQGGLIRIVSRFVGDRKLVLSTLPLAAVGFILLPLGATWQLMLGAMALAAVGMGLAGPNLNSMLSRCAGEREQGLVMGASQSVSSLALVVGPMIATPLYDHVGTAWPFVSAGGSILLGWFVFAALVKSPPAKAASES